jgi:hypothetical protein
MPVDFEVSGRLMADGTDASPIGKQTLQQGCRIVCSTLCPSPADGEAGRPGAGAGLHASQDTIKEVCNSH